MPGHPGAASFRTQKRIMYMAKWILSLICVVFLSGCAYQRAISGTQEYVDRGYSVNSIIFATDGDLISFGRLAGTPQYEIEDLSVIEQILTTTGVSVKITEPERESFRGAFSHSVIDEGLSNFSAAIERTLSRHQEAIGAGGSIEIVLVKQGVGAYRGIRSESDSPVSLSLLFHAPDPALLEEVPISAWWAAVLDNVAHELFHVHRGSSKFASKFRQIDEEAAATISGTCGLMDVAVSWGELPAIDYSTVLERPEGRAAFPGLSEGRFEPDIDALQQVKGVSAQGRTLATAVLYTKLPEGILEVADEGSRDLIYEYCSELLNEVPSFSTGEL